MIEYRGETFKDYNVPKLTPRHPSKKAAVLARVTKNGKTIIKLIRFGDQESGHNYSNEARERFKARFAKLIAKKDKLSPTFWADKFLWTKGGLVRQPPRES
tara:strand:- start:175 stop:477 length:303 start_codon:yes stop_codon:yes gene_type:complete